MLRRMELSTSFMTVSRVGELRITLSVTKNHRIYRARVVPSSHILVILMKEALIPSEISVLTRATRRNIPEDDIRQNMTCWILHSVSDINLLAFRSDQ
jgi:hypothetical protein